jgi:hypothetical protein
VSAMTDKKDLDRRAKKARSLPSGQLQEVQNQKKAAAQAADTRKVTVEVWGRGSANPLMRAFISEHRNQRTVKRTASEWINLFREWKEKPRG